MTHLSLFLLFLAFHSPEETAPKFEEQSSVSKHQVTIDGKPISYTATAGTIHLEDGEGKATASMFYIAYTRDGIKDLGKRPITFSFNGGPGSSSVWLHLGVLGPRRVLMDDEGNPLSPPGQLVENQYSILDRTDLVFIDPVGTGYSHALPGTEAKAFFGLEQDVEAVGELIRRYSVTNGRWISPKFLIGESYGTTRATGLVSWLQQRHGMYLNGVMLVSSILNFQTTDFAPGNDLPLILILPSYAATAWYHGKIEANKSLRDHLEEAKTFAIGPFASALMAGSSMSPEQRNAVVHQMSRLIGLSPEFIDQENLRIDLGKFRKQLLINERQVTGRLDGRFKALQQSSNSPYYPDPSYAAIQGPYSATLKHYLNVELGFKSKRIYEILGGGVNSWDFGSDNGYTDVGPRLPRAMIQNPHLKVFVANGYYDMATPFFATEYTFDHLDLTPSMRERVTMTYYESGHMMYIHMPSLKAMRQDMIHFIEDADGL